MATYLSHPNPHPHPQIKFLLLRSKGKTNAGGNQRSSLSFYRNGCSWSSYPLAVLRGVLCVTQSLKNVSMKCTVLCSCGSFSLDLPAPWSLSSTRTQVHARTRRCTHKHVHARTCRCTHSHNTCNAAKPPEPKELRVDHGAASGPTCPQPTSLNTAVPPAATRPCVKRATPHALLFLRLLKKGARSLSLPPKNSFALLPRPRLHEALARLAP